MDDTTESETCETNPEAFGVLQMSVNANCYTPQYRKSLAFWKSVEEKYKERKRKWTEANAKMIAAKLEAIRAKKQFEEANRMRQLDSIANNDDLNETQYPDAVDDEFSDIDQDSFKDPADRYYSSLDASTWSRIKQDIMTVHTRELAAPEERRSKLMGGLIVSVVLSIWIIIGGLYLLYKVELLPVYDNHVVRAECQLNCNSSSLLDDIVHSVFPADNTDDEV